MKMQREKWLMRILGGGVLGAVTIPLLSRQLLSLQYLEKPLVGMEQFVFPEMVQMFGSFWAAFAVQMLLGAILGAVIGISSLPFAEDGKSLVLQSLLHFSATAISFGALLWGCRWITEFRFVLVWIALLAVLYLLIWLVRWIGWWKEVRQIRALLGLTPGASPLHWKEILPYFPFLLLVCNIMPGVVMWIDLTFVVDVPIFSGILYPMIALPIIGFCSGYSLGRRQGMCWLYSVMGGLLYVPTVYIVYNSSAMFHCFMLAVPAMAGVLFGWVVWRRGRTKKTEL